MPNLTRLLMIVFVASIFCLCPLSGCEDNDAFENAGEKIDEAVDDAGEAIEDAGDKIKDATDGE